MPESFENDSPLFWPIVKLNEAYRCGDISPVEVLEKAIMRAEAFNPCLNAYLERLDEQARQQAKAAEKLFRNSEKDIPLLCGVPISIKDTFELAGSVTTYGSEFFRENITVQDCGLVQRLRDSGAVFTGKRTPLNLDNRPPLKIVWEAMQEIHGTFPVLREVPAAVQQFLLERVWRRRLSEQMAEVRSGFLQHSPDYSVLSRHTDFAPMKTVFVQCRIS